jgi:hypothetical protein
VLTYACVLVTCRYKSVLVSKKWMLTGVTGECNSDELPSHPSPSFPPEAVVEAQLAALRWAWAGLGGVFADLRGLAALMTCWRCSQSSSLASHHALKPGSTGPVQVV